MNKFLRFRCPAIIGMLTSLSAAILLFAMATAALAQQDYKTPQDAVDALVATARSGDQKAALSCSAAAAKTSFRPATRCPTTPYGSASSPPTTPNMRSR